MSPSRITSLVTGAVVFVFLGVGGLAAAQFGLTGPGMAEALRTDTETRVEQGRALVEKTCRPCRSVGVAGDSNNNKAPPFRGLHAQHPSFALREPLARGNAAPHEEKLRFTLSEVEIHSIVAYSNSPIKTGDRWPTSKTTTPAVTLIADVGDARKGLAYAHQVCSGCHNVLRTDAVSPNPQAPAFKKVANTPGMSITALTVWSRTTHPTMPNLVIELADMDDLIAYILSLRDR
jgi:mono/diheme cytochrome c family protein